MGSFLKKWHAKSCVSSESSFGLRLRLFGLSRFSSSSRSSGSSDSRPCFADKDLAFDCDGSDRLISPTSSDFDLSSSPCEVANLKIPLSVSIASPRRLWNSRTMWVAKLKFCPRTLNKMGSTTANTWSMVVRPSLASLPNSTSTLSTSVLLSMENSSSLKKPPSLVDVCVEQGDNSESGDSAKYGVVMGLWCLFLEFSVITWSWKKLYLIFSLGVCECLYLRSN